MDASEFQKQLRVYADTSVFGGCFNSQFDEASRAFFDLVREARFLLVLSTAVVDELDDAPVRVREILDSIPRPMINLIDLTPEIISLRNAYIDAGVVPTNSTLDAEHIAAATVGNADVVASWNFKHIVQFERIRGYNAVNLRRGYRSIAVHTPREVIP